MRTPTTLEDRWAWWERAIQGSPVPIYEDETHCGFFKMRRFRWSEWASRKNPWVPARIWMLAAPIDEAGELLDDEKWFCEINGNEADPWKMWTYLSKNPISESEWNYLKALSPLAAQAIPARN